MNRISIIIIFFLVGIVHSLSIGFDRISKLGDGALLLKFDSQTEINSDSYKIGLSNDKQNIDIDFPDIVYNQSYKDLSLGGKFNGLHFQNLDGMLSIRIKLSDIYGFTCMPQPKSNSMVIEVFKWTELTPKEDAFRNALLALESGFIEDARSELKKAFDLGHLEAAPLVAYVSDDNTAAMDYLLDSKVNLTIYPDVCENAASLFMESGLEDKAKKWTERRNEILDGKILAAEQPSNSVAEEKEKPKSVSEETTIAVADRVDAENKEKSLSELLLLGILAITVVGVFTTVLFRFQKKKKNELDSLVDNDTQSPNIDAEEENEFAKLLNEAKKKRERQKIGKKDAIISNGSHNDEKYMSPRKKAYLDVYRVDSEEKASSLNKEKHFGNVENRTTKGDNSNQINSNGIDNNSNKLEKFLETFIPQKKKEIEKTPEASEEIKRVIDAVEKANIYNKSNKATPEMELALKLAKSQNESKNSELRKIDFSKLEENPKLEELTRRLNLDMTSVITKKKLDMKANDSERLSKLRDRFNV
ncbi:MAG: hypothetical protein Kapaf2KO_08830 [Candidatus Kapaibacteriales bacterium]